MSQYNQNSGFGAGLVAQLPFAGTGKHFVVGASTVANKDMLKAVFGYDPDGDLRFFSDIDTAIGECTSAAGDKILVMPGHTETLSAAGAVALDVIGVQVLGIGEGANVPTLTFSNTAATVAISAASCSFKNIAIVPSVNAVVAPISVTGSDCELDLIVKDASDTVEFVKAVLATSVSRLKAKIKYEGRTGGSACVAAVQLVGCSGVDLDMDCYGKASTAWVNTITTASTDVRVTGYMYNSGTTTGAKDFVDTITGSTWFMSVDDGAAGSAISGGSAAAVAAGDLSVIAASVGGVADAAVADTIEGAAASTQSAISDIKAVMQRIGADSANNTAATTLVGANADGSVLEREEYIQTKVDQISTVTLPAAPVAGSLARFVASGGTALGTPLAASKSLIDVLGSDGTTVTDSAVSVLGAIGANSANNAFDSSSVATNHDGSVLERLEGIKDLVGGTDSVANVIGADNANNGYSSASVVVNGDGSVLERLEYVQDAELVAGADASTNVQHSDVTGNKTDAAVYAGSSTASVVGYLKGLEKSLILATGTFTTSSATVPADTGRTEASNYWNGCVLLPVAGAVSGQPRRVVGFNNTGGVFTLDSDMPFTAVPGTVAYVIVGSLDSITPAANATVNTTPAHVLGNKSDTAVTAVGTTTSVAAYAKGLVTMGTVQTANSTNNAFMGDVVGNKIDTVLGDAVEGGSVTTNSIVAIDKAIAQRVGADNANNTFASTNVAANADGSVLEREEYIQTKVNEISTSTLPASPAVGTLATFLASGGTSLGTALAASKSIVDVLGSNGTTVSDSATSVLGAIGADNANNAFSSASVVANVDGSVLERLEDLVVKVTAVDDIIDAEFPVVATAVGAVADAALADTIEGAAASTQSVVTDLKGVLQRIGADSANNTAATTLVTANDDGSLLERLEGIKQGVILARGTITSSSASIPADTGRTEADNYWNGCYIVPMTGSIAGQARQIVDFSNTGGVFTLDADLPFTAVPGLVAYVIIPGPSLITPAANSTANGTPSHVVGNKTDTAVTDATEASALTTNSLAAIDKAVLQRIGADNNNNTCSTSSVVANENGSVLERLEYVQANGTPTAPNTYVPGLGYRVTKTEDVNTATSDDLFTVTGKVLITMWTGEVTNALGAGPTDYKLSMTTLTADLCAATNLSSAIAGYMFQLSSDAGLTILTGSSYAVSVSGSADTNGFGMANRIVGKSGGSDTLKSVRTAGDASDAIVHTVFYLPLEAGAGMATAA